VLEHWSALTFRGLWNCTLWGNGATICIPIHRQLSARKSLPFTPVLTIRIKEPFHFDLIIPFLSRRRRPAACKRWVCLVLTTQQTLHSAVSAHISSDYAKTSFRIQHPSNITNIGMRTSDIVFITKSLQMCCRQKWNSNIFLHKNLFQRKKGQKRAKRPNKCFKASQLEMRPKKGRKANWNFLGQSTWNEAKFLKFGLKKANLATLTLTPLTCPSTNLKNFFYYFYNIYPTVAQHPAAGVEFTFGWRYIQNKRQKDGNLHKP